MNYHELDINSGKSLLLLALQKLRAGILEPPLSITIGWKMTRSTASSTPNRRISLPSVYFCPSLGYLAIAQCAEGAVAVSCHPGAMALRFI